LKFFNVNPKKFLCILCASYERVFVIGSQHHCKHLRARDACDGHITLALRHALSVFKNVDNFLKIGLH